MSALDTVAAAAPSSGAELEEADVAIAAKLGRNRNRPTVKVLGGLSEIADQAPAFTLCACIAAAGLIAGRPKLTEAGARMLASTLLATALKGLVKSLVSRTRPHALMDTGEYEFRPLGAEGRDQHSFPSGHTADAVAAARAFARVYPAASLPAYGVAVAIGAVQVPRAKHYPIDVAGGLLVGIAAEAITHLAAAAVERRFAVPREDDPSDGGEGRLAAASLTPPSLPGRRRRSGAKGRP